ncbi:cobalamin ECF transporter [Enterococcus faecalis]
MRQPTFLRFPTRRITTLALFSAACIVGRLLFTWIPNVQPMSAILLLLAFYGSYADTLIVTIVSLLGTNLYLGMGSWTISQLLAFSSIVTLFLFLSKITLIRRYTFLQALVAFFCGLCYGLIVSKVEVFIHQLPSFWAYYFQGLFFDVLHGSGNFVFYLLLAPVFKRVFKPVIHPSKIDR